MQLSAETIEKFSQTADILFNRLRRDGVMY
jgi:hypothetical protein